MSGTKLPTFVEGAKGGGYTPVQDADSLRSTAKGRVVDLIAEGEIVGLVDGGKSIFFDDTPLVAADGSFNFSNVSYDIRYGLPQQEPLSGFDSVESEVVANREVTADIAVGKPGPYEFSLTNPDLDAVRVKIRVPALVQQTDKSDVLKASVQLKIEVRAGTGAYQQVVDDVIYGKTTAGYERAYRVNLPKPATNWSVRITRITPDSTSEKLQNKTVVSSYTQIIDAKLIYPDSAVVGVSLDAGTFNGGIPTRGYHIRGRKIQVPTNYDPVSRTYATTGPGTTGGVWNGTFKTAYSNNPAWVLYDVLDNDRFGLGEFVDTSQIDKFSLYTIGQYCDQLVSDGNGGMEPRFTINCSVAERVEAYNLVQSIASNFRAMAFWSVGAISAVQDSPKDAVQLLTPSNVINGDFSYQSTGLKDRHTVALVTWNDPEDRFRPAVEVVENPEGIKRYGYRPIDIYAFGCTSQGQAYRFGKWMLETEYSEKEAISYTASIDHIGALPGQIIAVADPTKSGTRNGGRIAGGTTTSVILDSPIATTSGDYLSVMLNDGSLATIAVTPNAVASTTVSLVTALPEVPTVGNVWVLYGGAVKQRLYRVIAISERENNLFEIQGVAYDPTKFARVEQGLAFDPVIRDTTFTARVASPSNLSILEGSYLVNNQVRSRLLVSWSAPDSYASAYEIRVSSPSGAATNWSTLENTYYEVSDAELGNYFFEVRSVGINNTRSAAITLNYTALGKSAPPGKPTALTATAGIRSVTLNWTNPVDADLNYVDVFAGSTNVLASAVKIGAVSGTTFTHVGVTAGTTYYYWVRAVDSSGNIGEFHATLGVSAVPLNEAVTSVVPANVAGLTLSTASTVQPDGTVRVKLVANWTAAADASYYEVEVKESTGSYIGYQTATTSFELVVAPSTLYTVRVRAISTSGQKSAGYSTVSTITSTNDTTAPAVPTSLSIVSSLRSAFLSWTNPADADLSATEVWFGTANNSASATRVSVVTAEPGRPGAFSHSGLSTGVAYFYWLKSVDTSGNTSGFNTAATAGTTVTPGSVTDSDIVAGTISGDRVVANTITGDRFLTSTSLPGTITVGTTGVSIDTVKTNADTGAQNPATRINNGVTTIDPGKILISGTTTLASWRNGADATKIDGGNIAANTISANQVTVGLRGLDIAGLEFEAQKTAPNILSWSAGTISFVGDNGNPTTASITAGTATWTTGTLYIYWIKSGTVLNATTIAANAYGADKVVVATYLGGTNLVVNYGRTIIDGSQITTGTVNANVLKTGSVFTNSLFVGSQSKIALDGANNEIYQQHSTNTTKIFQSTSAGVTLRKPDGTVILDTSNGVNNTALGLTASNIGGLAATATSSDFSAVTGTTKPDNNATVGAIAGTNLKDSVGTVLTDTAIKNTEQLWADIEGPGLPADNAGTTLKLVAIGTNPPVIVGNRARKTTGNAFDSAAVNAAPFRGAAYAACDIGTGIEYSMPALDDDATNTDRAGMNAYLQYQRPNGAWEVYAAGLLVASGTTTANLTGQALVTYDGVYFQFFVNGTLLHTRATSANLMLYAKWCVYGVGSPQVGMQAGFATDRAYSQIEGPTKPENNATNDRFQDTRNTNQPPSWYWTNYSYRTAHEFKDGFYLAIPGVPALGYYGALITRVDYADASGGPIKQEYTVGTSYSTNGLASGQKYLRYSTGLSTWSAWAKDFSALQPPRLGSGGELLTEGGSALTDSLARNDLQRFDDIVAGNGKPENNANNTYVDANGAIQGVSLNGGIAVRNTLIQIGTDGSFVNAGATGNGTSVNNALVAKRFISRGSIAAIIQGNTIYRASGDGDYNSFVSGEAVAGTCFAEVFISSSGWTMLAFDTAATTGNYGSQDFVVHANPAISTDIYRNGILLASLGAQAAGQLLRIAYDGVYYRVFVSGTQIGTTYDAPAGQRFFPIFNAYNLNIRYSGLNYGPYTDNAWASVGGTGRPEDSATVGAKANVNLRKEDSTLVADPDFLNNRLEGNVLRISTPVGGALSTNGGQTGAIKIALPAAGLSTMVRFYVDVYEYDPEASQTYEVGGYTYSASTWINCFANAIGRSPSVRTVRFGREDGLFCVYIGELNGVWSYPKVRIRDVTAGYSNFEEAKWKEGWALSWKTSDFPSIAATVAKPVAGDAISGVNTRREGGAVVGDALLMNDNQRFDQVIAGYGRPSDNATSDLKLTASGTGLTVSGNYVTRDSAVGGSWNASVHTETSYVGGAIAQFSPDTAVGYSASYMMAGLNTDPTADISYASLDYCFFVEGDANVKIYESNSLIGTFGTYTYGVTVLSVVYDNEYVRYLISGTEVRSVYIGAGKRFYFDSSIVQGSIRNIRFGPYAAANSPLTFIEANTGISAEGNTAFKRNNGGGGWTKLFSSETSIGTAFVSGRLATTSTFIGLHPVGSTATDYSSLSASWHRSTNGYWYSYIGYGGINHGTGYTDATKFMVTYDGANYRWYADGVLVRTAAATADLSFQAGVSIDSPGARVSEIQFGPYTDRTWNNIAGTGKPENNATVGATAGTNLRRANATVLGDNDIITSLGTALNIANQAATATSSDFSVVTGTTKPANYATADITLVGKGTGIVIKGNNVSRPTGGGAWTAGAYTADGYTGGAFCSFSYPFATEIMAGLNTDPLTENGYGSIDYCWYCPAAFTALTIYESGSAYGGFGPFTATTVLSVTYDNEYVRYLKDGVEVRSVYVGAGKKYHFDSSVVAGEINNVRFGPYAAANAPLSFINTAGHTSEGNTVFKRANATNDWDGKSISREISQGTAFVTGKLDTVDTFIGLHEVGNSAPNYGSFAYSIHRSSNGTWAVYEDGGSPLNLGSGYDNNTQWSVRYDGVNVRYYAGTTLLRTVGSPADRSFQAGVSIFSKNSRVSAVQFGPYTDRSWSNIAGAGRPENYATVGAVAGTNLYDTAGNALAADHIRNNLAITDWWRRDASIPWSQNYEYNRIISLPTDNSSPPPRAGGSEVWYCEEVSNNGDPGGGWNGGVIAPLDKTRTYRFAILIRRLAGSGTSYWGCEHIAALNTTADQGNPYFAASQIPANKWFLFVGYLYPAGSTGNTSDSAGIWDCDTGIKFAGGTNYNHRPVGPNPTHRAYQYYASQNASQLFSKPFINLVDGTEPSLREYFAEAALLNTQQRFDHIVAGNGKPEAYATRGSNRVFNGDASLGTEGWTVTTNDGGSFEVTGTGEAIGGSSSFRLVKSAPGVGHLTITSRPIPVVPGQKLFYRFKAYGSHAPASGLYFRINQRGQGAEPTDMDGHGGSLSDVQSNIGVSFTTQSYEAPYTVPAGVYWVSISVLNWVPGPQVLIVDDIYLGENQIGADVTLTSQITTQAPDDVIINADYLGTIIPNQFNKVATPVVTRGGVSVRTDNRATYTVSNVTGGLSGFVSVNNTAGSADKGRATITNCTATGSYQHNIFWDNVLIASYVVRFTVVAADAPIGGGGSGGTGNKSGSFDCTGFGLSSTAFVTVGTISNLTKSSGETIRATAPAIGYYVYNPNASVSMSMVAKWQYSPAGANSWTDFPGGNAVGSASDWFAQDFSGNSGSVTCNRNVVPADGAYDLRFQVAMDYSQSQTQMFIEYGTASVVIGP